jgi:hypothetical protein
MLRRTILVPILSLCLALAGCDKDKNVTETGRNEQQQGAPSAHAPANVTPGSHEDWCEEHGVPESQCTRCDPSLSAAFKATGDWCEEHGLPESQCKKCNPDIQIVRPAKTN